MGGFCGMGFKASMLELRDFFNYKRKETTVRARLVKRSIRKQSEQKVYVNFKRVLFEEIDASFYKNGYSKIVIKPKKGREDLFDMLIDDEDFKVYYEGRLDIAGNLEVSPRLLDV